MTPAVVCLTASGAPLARRIAVEVGGAVHGRQGRVDDADAIFDDTAGHLRTLFAAGVPVIGVCAAGILIRALAPMLARKRAEPPVLAVAEDGSAVVPLLGGHRGANALARRIAGVTGGAAAVTTAGEVALGVALDAPPPGWRLADPAAARPAMAALLAGGGADIAADGPVPEWLAPLPRGDAVRISAGLAPAAPEAARPHLVYHPLRATLGLGASRGCPAHELAALADAVLAEAGVAPAALRGLFTLDLKADEPAMLALGDRLALPLRLFPAAELEAETPRLSAPSETVFAEVGCHGVAEAAALAAAGPGARLAVTKRKTAHATAALAIAPEPIEALPGRPRGHLAIVGIGPGDAAWRTPEASRLIAEADELVGYGLYLDLLGPLAAGKPRHDFPLGAEEARCRFALERAGEGRRVALVSSGDPGIYAMGALVFELLDRPAAQGGVSPAARRAEVVSAPGISALQAAAARAGAPLGHDFCASSLSDLLTPREDILRRIRAAATGDFVIAFYNPVSRRRRTLLAEARDMLLRHRPPDTPVLLASNLGRTGERLAYRRLADLSVDEVDMLTVVLVGSSQSRLAEFGEGPRLYTPRGYARKIDAEADT
ncbi:MAG TPA: precorrin-3B C(17)-methyltransferase [Thermohalobaculum sp.]|nr:precorrin-3B C(17)-methyltransferase [Thermohalobaculum sp.]